MSNTIYNTIRAFAFETHTPLAANAVYTSPSIDTIAYSRFSGIITADVAGSFFLQYSDDNITWYNSTATAPALSANAVSLIATANVALRYLRYVFTNGAAPQTVFKISVYLIP